ncbi:hypothetical protein F5146DRAFT_1119448 [Armillaria mellea]|nr:hypothetical protein F5146DRAFT_1119448 [Armillaria mellea]
MMVVRRRPDDALLDSSVSATPMIMMSDREGNELPLDHLDFSGPPMSISVGPDTSDVVSGAEMKAQPAASGSYTTEPAQQPLVHATLGTPTGEGADPIGGMARQGSYSSSEPEDESSGSGTPESEAVPPKKSSSGEDHRQDFERMTGQLEEEKMQGTKGRMEGNGARRLLKSLSIKQGIKYDAPESARDIPAFIEFHRLKVDPPLLYRLERVRWSGRRPALETLVPVATGIGKGVKRG